MSKNEKVFCDCNIIHEEVVKKVHEQMPSKENLNKLADLYKVFADKTRVSILWALQKSEMCVCDLAALLNMTKSAISHQLKFLRLANLVKYNKEGKVVYYSLADCRIKEILEKGFEHSKE